MIHLREINPSDQNGIESIIYKMGLKGEAAWFPQMTCLKYQKYTRGALEKGKHINDEALDRLEEKLDNAEDSIKRLEEVLEVIWLVFW